MKQIYQIFTLNRLFHVIFSCFFLISYANVEASEWRKTEFSQTRLISAATSVGGDAHILLGLHIKLEPGWKTYWRSPGDSGIPPQFNWKGSSNVEKTEILWPKPSAFNSFGLLTWGYKDEVVFPVKITLKDRNKPLVAALELFYGICEEVCIPVRQEFQISLAIGETVTSPDAGILKTYMDRVPSTMDGETGVSILISQNKSENMLDIEVGSTLDFEKPVLILEGREGDFFVVKETRISEDKQQVTFSVEVDLADKNTSLKGQDFTATILDATMAVEGRVTVK